MQILTLRPTFDLIVDCPKSEFYQAIRQNLKSEPWEWRAFPFENYIELHIPEDQIRFWSPHLSLYFEERGESTRVLGRFGPRQNVWMLVWFAYLTFAFGAFFCLMYAIAAWLTKIPTAAGYVCVLLLAGIAAIYAISYVGQSWSRDQMENLRLACNTLFRMSCPKSQEPVDS